MFTLEQKVDLIMRYIATSDKAQRSELKEALIHMLQGDNPTPANTPNIDTDDLIVDLLKEVGMPPHLIGYQCTTHALRLILSDPEYLRDITCRLYPDVAKCISPTYTRSRAERAIRHAVEVVFDRGDIEHIQELFSNTVDIRRGKLTNSEFLAFCEVELRRRIKKANRVAV
jgi:two-component system response regulator (stage 0 sporulation protein A)